MSQLFRIWAVPLHRAPVTLTTVLSLALRTPAPGAHVPHGHDPAKRLYYIKAQNDLYQVDEFVKFFSVLRLVWLAVRIWQFVATAFCVLGAYVGAPVTWAEERAVGRDASVRGRDGTMHRVGGREVLHEVRDEVVVLGNEALGRKDHVD